MDARIDVDTLLEQSRWLRALALRLARDDASADDLVQDTLVAAIERPPPRSDDVGGLRGWLAKVLRNRARETARSERIRAHHEPRAARTESIDDGHDQALDQVRLQRALAAAILELPEPYRKAITLRWVDGLSARDVATAQSITYEAARQRLARGAALLREKLDRDCRGRASWSALVLALPNAAPRPVPPILPEIVAVSTLTKVLAVAVVLVAAILWFTLPRGSTEPDARTEAPGVVDALDPVETGLPALQKPASDGERTALAMSNDATASTADAERLLSGIVIDPEGKPVSGAALEVRRPLDAGYVGLDLDSDKVGALVASARSGVDGRFHIEIEPGRPHTLFVEAESFARARLSFRYAAEDVVVRLERGAILTGRVLRAADDAPVVGARVRIWPRRIDNDAMLHDSNDVFVGKTDAGGNFRADGLFSGGFFLEVMPIDECPPMWREIELASGATLRVDIRVQSGPTLKGVVLDARTKLPIVGASVGAGWVMARAVKTDALGEFALKGFPLDGVFDIGVRAPGFGFKTVPVRADTNAPFPERMTVVMAAARKAHGRIVDARGKPIEGALVAGTASEFTRDQQTDWITTRSSPSGAFELADLRYDLRHALNVRHDGYGTITFEFPRDEPRLDTVDLGDVVMPDMAVVRGTVRRPDGEPVPDHVVLLKGWNSDRLKSGAPQQSSLDWYVGERQSRTDDKGRFTFADVAGGEYRVQVNVSGIHEPVERTVQVANGARVDGQDLVLDAGLSIAGTLVGPDGEPVTECFVSIDPTGPAPATSADARSDAQGRFHVSGLAPGAYELSTWHHVTSDQRNEKKQYAHRVFGPVNAGDQSVVITLQIASVLRGRVLDAKGVPVANAYLIAKTALPGHESERQFVDVGGHFEFEIPSDVEVELVAGPPPPEVADPTTGSHVAAANAPDGADPEPDPARSVRRSGLHAGKEEVELRLPANSHDR